MNREPASNTRAETHPLPAKRERLAEAIYLMLFSDNVTRRRVTALAERHGLSRADLRAEVLRYVDRLAACDQEIAEARAGRSALTRPLANRHAGAYLRNHPRCVPQQRIPHCGGVAAAPVLIVYPSAS